MNIKLFQQKFFSAKPQENFKKIKESINNLGTNELGLFSTFALCGNLPQSSLKYLSIQEEIGVVLSECIEISANKNFIVFVPEKENNSLILCYISNKKFQKISFQTTSEIPVIDFEGQKIGLTLFGINHLAEISKEISTLICFGKNSIGIVDKDAYYQELSLVSKKNKIPVVFVDNVGSAANLLYPGGSFCVDESTNSGIFFPYFKDFSQNTDIKNITASIQKETISSIAFLQKALVIGIQDYMFQRNFKKVVLGLSGGLDSALVAALAVEALGNENVKGILMPSEFSSDHSVNDAVDLAKNLHIEYEILPIKNIYKQCNTTLDPIFSGTPFSLAEENLQARIRGLLLMAVSNKTGAVLLNTSNKSECAVGYGTLYGDMCGSLAVIGDLYKTEAFEMARYINREVEIIPENTISKPPSAELRPNQKDSDSLPDYPILDRVLFAHIEENKSAEEIFAENPDIESLLITKVLQMVANCEYKRRQAAPCLKLKPSSFGIERLMPF